MARYRRITCLIGQKGSRCNMMVYGLRLVRKSCKIAKNACISINRITESRANKARKENKPLASGWQPVHLDRELWAAPGPPVRPPVVSGLTRTATPAQPARSWRQPVACGHARHAAAAEQVQGSLCQRPRPAAARGGRAHAAGLGAPRPCGAVKDLPGCRAGSRWPAGGHAAKRRRKHCCEVRSPLQRVDCARCVRRPSARGVCGD